MSFDISVRSAEGIVTLLQMKGVGKQTAPRLAERYERLGDILEAPEAEIDRLVPKAATVSIRDEVAWHEAIGKARGEFDRAEQNGTRIYSAFDSDYPELLRLIPDRPPVVYVKGKLKPGRRNVACVGTREPTNFGCEVGRRLVKLLVEHDWSIVSGLAIGIDAVSHRTAIENQGHTVAILANGLDSVYPKENRELAAEILDTGGAIISEQPFGARAFAQNLIDRDRLQCGMSVATFVMQTDVRGGTMHTVRFTLTQGRMLFAPVPPSRFAHEDKCQGIRAITEQTGTELATTLKASASYRDLLLSVYAHRNPAIPIKNTGDYPAMFAQLEEAVTAKPSIQIETDNGQRSLHF